MQPVTASRGVQDSMSACTPVPLELRIPLETIFPVAPVSAAQSWQVMGLLIPLCIGSGHPLVTAGNLTAMQEHAHLVDEL